jgi:cytidyltransferase-like protein
MYLSFLSNEWPFSLWTTLAIPVCLTLVRVASTLIWPIFFPQILSYPWPMPEDYDHRQRDRNHTVVLAGSYNPPHNGHMAMIRYLSERFGQVILVVGSNPNKKYLVSPDHRAKLIRRMLKDTGTPASNVRVEGTYSIDHTK